VSTDVLSTRATFTRNVGLAPRFPFAVVLGVVVAEEDSAVQCFGISACNSGLLLGQTEEHPDQTVPGDGHEAVMKSVSQFVV
jgi:hypothetical protein